MARNILIIRGHPDLETTHYCDALVAAYAVGAEAAGHNVESIDIARLDLPYLRSGVAWKAPAPNADIRRAQERVAWANHIVIIYPLWLGDMPALLKSFFEQVSCNDFGMVDEGGPRLRQGLKGKSARIIVTMGMPAFVYRWFYFAHSLKNIERNILKFAGVKPVVSTLIGSIEEGVAHRAAWLETVRDLGRRAA